MANPTKSSGCLGIFLKLIGIGSNQSSAVRVNFLPYRLRENFLSAAELTFYRALEQAVSDMYRINNKVRLWDVLYVPRSDESRKYENKISSKHLDFLLCDPATMQPVLAIELDDISHNRKDRQERDAFVDQALAAAGLPVLHIRAARTYSIAEIQQQIAGLLPETALTVQPSPPLLPSAQTNPADSNPTCPKCHAGMVRRKASKGNHAGKRFWACVNYPQCREIIRID